MGIEIPAGLQWVSYLAGEQWPKGDETAMFQIGDDWNSSSQQISDLIPKLQQAQSQTASAVSGQTASAVAGQFQSLLSGDTSIQTLVSSMSSLGSLATQTGTQIQYTKLQILSTLGIAAAEIAYALSSVEWTFGASLAWIPPIEGITIAVVRQLVSQLIKRLLAAVAETLTKTGLRQLVKDAVVGAAVGAGIGIVQDLAIEAYQIHEGVRSGIDWGQVAEISVGAVVGGALGSVAHGLLSKSIGDPSTIGGKALKGAVTHFSVGAVGNVAGAGATGGGLNAEDIFGGAGGGAVSGGIHGGKEPPKGGAHGEKDSTSDTDTSPDDDSDEASIKTLVGPDSSELPNGSNDHFPANGPGPEGDSASPPDDSTPPPPPQESSAGPSGQASERVPSTTPTVSSAAGDTPASPGTADGLGAGRGAGVSTGEGQGSPSGSSAAGGAGAGVVSGGHDPAGAGGAGVGAGGAAASGGGSAGRVRAGSNGSGVGGHSGSAGVVDPAGASVAGRATVLSSGSAEGVARAGAVGSPNASVAGAGPDSRASRSGAASGSRSGPTAAAPAARVADTAAPKTGAGGKSGGAGQRSPEPGRLVAAQPSPGADRAAHGAGDPEEGNEFPDAVRPPVDMSQEAGHSEDSGASLPDTSDPAGRSKDSSATPSPDRSDHRPADRDDDRLAGGDEGRDHLGGDGVRASEDERFGPPDTLPRTDSTIAQIDGWLSEMGARSGDVLGDESWRHDPAVSADWFAPKDAVSPQQWEGRRGGAYVRSVDTEVADVKSESTPGRLTSYRGLIRYDLRRIEVAPNRFVQDYTLKVHLTPGSGVDADTVAAVQAKATAGVDGLLNRGFRLPSGDQFHVTVEFTDGPGEAHTTIEVGHTNTDQTHWNPKASASLLAHEALHYLGVPDEYVDSGRVLLRHDTNSGVHQGDGGMMGADVHGGDAGLRPRHLWIVERTANSQVAVPDTRLGDHHNPTTTARPHTPNTDTPTPNTRPTPTTNKPHTAPDGGDRRDESEPARDRDTASDDARVSGWFDSDDDARVSGWFDSDDDARVSGWFDSGGESPTAPAGSDILHVSFDNVDGDRIERDIPTSFHPGSFGPTPPVPDPRFPTAQLGFDPTEPPVQITGVPQGQSVQHRTDTNFLFRDDHRGPLGAVHSPFEWGFAVRDPSNSNLSQHVNGERNANFVSTSRDPNVAFNGPSNYKEEGRPNFRYIIHAPGGIEVNATLGPHRFGNQSEVAFPGGIRAQNIVGAQEIIGGTLRPGADIDIPGGQFENLQFGPFIPNRHFDPSAANPPGPDPRFARLTNNPGNDDSDSLFEASSSESSRPNTPPGPSRDNSGDGDSPVRRSPPPAANVPEAGPASASGSPTDVGSSAADPRLHQQVERTPNTDTPTPNTRPAPTASNALTGPDGGDRRDESESGQREPVREQLQRPKDAASRPSSLRHPMAVHSTDQLSGSASQPQRSDTDAGAALIRGSLGDGASQADAMAGSRGSTSDFHAFGIAYGSHAAPGHAMPDSDHESYSASEDDDHRDEGSPYESDEESVVEFDDLSDLYADDESGSAPENTADESQGATSPAGRSSPLPPNRRPRGPTTTDSGAGDPRHRDPAPSMPPDGQPARPDHHRSPSVGDTPRAVDPFIEALVPDEDRVSSAAGSSGHEEPEADSATRTPPPATSKPDATARASHSTADTEEDTSRPAPTEQPNRAASASTPDRAGEPRPKSEAVARNADNHATRSTKPKDPAELLREGSRRPTSDSEASHEQSSTHPPPSGLLHGFPPEDTGPADRPRSGGDVPVLRLRGGAGEGNRFRQTLNDYARRIFGPGNHANSDELVQGLNDEARRVQSEREAGSRPPAPKRFGLDPFGLRDPSDPPPHLNGRKLADVPTSSLGEHIHALDMARREGDPPPAKLDIWSEPVPPGKRWLSDNGDGRPSGPLPERLEMPAVFHSIWLGGPVTEGRKATDLVRGNLEKLSKVAQRGGMRVVLWTDVPRTDFDRPGGDAAKMLSWARRHNISLLSPNEVFHRDEPMTLAGEYRLENAKGTAAGYTAASDMLRLEILHRFGGIYTDHDNQVRRLGGLRNLLRVQGFALHSRGDGIANNSALLSARAHPFVKQYLEQIKSNYRKVQSKLHPDVHSFVENNAKAQHEKYVTQHAFAVRRRSVTERTGPFNLKDVTESLKLNGADVPRIHTDQLDMGSAHTWLSTKPLRTAPEQTSRVLQHAISGLIWDLHNREGDLNLAAVAPLIEGLPDPAAGWKAVVEYMRSVPELRDQVQTVTYAYLRPKSIVPLSGDRPRIRQLDLPKSVLDTFGLPQHERVTDLKGNWRRAAFAANIEPGVWRGAARASLSDDVEPMSFARMGDIDNDTVLHGLAADDSATPDHAAHDGQPTPLQELPAGTRRLTAFPESRNSIDEIRSWIGDVNNDGDAAIAPSGARLQNCAPATMVVFDRLSGTPSFGRAYVGGPTGDGRSIHELTRDELGEATGLPLERSSPERIAERLAGQRRGAHTVVAIKYRNGEQHSFNAHFDGTQVHALDGQHGTIKPWPPALDRANNPVEQWFMGTPPDSARSAPTPDSGNGSPQGVLHSLPSDGPRADDLSVGLLSDDLFDSSTPLPSAQLDSALSLDSVTGIPDGHSAHIRTDNVRLYRDDTRSPSEVFGVGFAPLDPTKTNLTNFVLGRPGAFVSTTRDAELNHLGPPTEARPHVFRYHIVAPGGIDVNPTLPHHQDGHEGEVAFLGGIRRENILGAEQVLEGRPEALRLGEFVRNDHFDPRTPNPHFPADPPRESTDSPDASDDDLTPMNTPRARPASLPSVSPDTQVPLQGLPDGDGGGPEQSRPVRAQHADPNPLQRNDTTVDNVDASAPAERVDDNPTSHDARNELVARGSHHPAAAGDTKVGPASRLRGGATGTDALFGSLRYHADRLLRPRVDSSDSNELIANLTAEAERVQQERVGAGGRKAVAEDRFGPDPFGLRDPSPTPQLLHDVRLADVPTEGLGFYFRSLDLAGVDDDKGPSHDEIWSEQAPPDGQWWRPEDLPSDSDPLPPLPRLPERLEMPKMVHSIWLGGPVTDGRDVTDEVRRNVEELSRKAQAEGMRVALWTDVTRGEFEENTGDVGAMRDWARSHNIMLLNADEVFHGGERMRLAAEYRLETGKGTAAGYTAASDILRLEILHRFGGLYTDGDNEVYDLAGLRDYLRAPGFAAHGTPPNLNNSALLAARKHPFIANLLDTIADNYRLRQDELQPHNHVMSNLRRQHTEHYVGRMANKRRSVMERTGPSNLEPARKRLGLNEIVPRIHEDKIQMASAKTWLSDTARQYPPEKTPWVLQHAISGLIWDLRNRRGDLNLAAVAPLIEGLRDPAAGWEAVVGYIHRVPQLRLQVQTVTYSRIEYEDSAMEHVGGDRELELPQSVRNMLGLPPHGHASDVPGVWRRAAFGTQVRSRNWSYLNIDFPSGERREVTPLSELGALVSHLNNLGDQWRSVEVSVEGGGAAWVNNAGKDRANAVRQYLEPLVDNPEIRWNDPTSRGPGPTKAPVPPDVLENRRQVIVSWKAKPVGSAGEDISELERSAGQSDSPRPADFTSPPQTGTGAEFFDEDPDEELIWNRGLYDDPASTLPDLPQGVLRGLPSEDPAPAGAPPTVELPQAESARARGEEEPSQEPADGSDAGSSTSDLSETRYWTAAESLNSERYSFDHPFEGDPSRPPSPSDDTLSQESFVTVPEPVSDPEAEVVRPQSRSETSLGSSAASVDHDLPVVAKGKQRADVRPDADASTPPSAERPEPEPTAGTPDQPDPVSQLPSRIGDNLVLGGTDVVEEFLSGDEALEHVKELVLREGGEEAWRHNREQIIALFSDDALRPKVPGMLRGGRAIKRVFELAPGRTLAVDLRLDGASEASALHYKEDIEKYEYEHNSDPTNTVGSSVQRRSVWYAGAQGNFTHPNVTITPTLLGFRTHDSSLNEVLADRQVSGAQTAEPSTRFHGTIKATITHKLDTVRSVHEPESHDIIYRAQVVVPKRDVEDRGDDAESDASAARATAESQPGPSDSRRPAESSGGPPRVHDTRALSGSDVVTNLWLVPDDLPTPEHGTEQQPHREGTGPAEETSRARDGESLHERDEQSPSPRPGRPQNPRVQTIPDLLGGVAMRAAFQKAYGKLAVRAFNETDNWLTLERLQSNLHGMTNKQPLVLRFESIPGARLEVHAFIEPIGTPSAARSVVGPDAKYRTDRLMRATGKTKETEFHYGTETDTSQVRQDAVTWSAELPTPSRIRGEGGTNTGEFSGGFDANHVRGHTESESDSRRYRARNTLKNPVPGQAWHGQVRLRFEMHPPPSASPSLLAAAFKGTTHQTFKGAVHETRARFDALIEESETTPVEDYKDREVWAPPSRIWGGGPPAEHRSVAEAPWWRTGTGHRTVRDVRNPEVSRAMEQPAPAVIPRGEDGIVPSHGMASMDRVTNLDLSGFHGMVDYMGRRAFGGDWANISDDVSSWYHLNRVRDALPAMTQQSPLSRTQLTGPGSKAKTSLIANFEELKFQRVIEPLSSPSTEAVEGSAKTIDHNRQTTLQAGLGGRGGDVAGSPVLGEAILGGQNVTRDSERLGDQQRVAVATKFTQKMAIFDGWVRLDGYMSGSVATVHESGLFPVEIAIPLSELQGSRTHQDHLRPTFNRDNATGFVAHPDPPVGASDAAPPDRDSDARPAVTGSKRNVLRKPRPGVGGSDAGPVRDASEAGRPVGPTVTASDHAPPQHNADARPVVTGSKRNVLRKPRPGVGGSDAGPVRADGPDAPAHEERPEAAETQPTADSSTAPVPGPSLSKWNWTAPPTEQHPPKPPPHALQGSWHPSDMVVGVDRNTGLQEAIRQDLAAVLDSDLDDAMVGVSNHFGPRVLAARLTHESGRQWSHDIPVPGGHITVKVRPVREGTYKYVSPSEKFEVDMSTEMESSIMHTHGSSLRTVKGGRLQVPFPHGSVSVQLTHTGSVLPKEDTTADADHGVTQLSDVNIPNISGENDYRLPMRVRTTQAHNLFRQPIRFEISYEQSLGAKVLSTKEPEEPKPVRLTAVFSYPKHTPTAAEETATGHDAGEQHNPSADHPQLEVKQAVMEVRPHLDTHPTGAGNDPHADVERPAPDEDPVAAHILESMADEGRAVFGDDWPSVRAELAGHLKTMAVQRDLNDFSRGGTRVIKLKSVRGGEVELGAHLDTMDVADSDATTEFYSGRQQALVAAVARTKLSNWQGYVQAQGDVLPSGDTVNLSVQGQISGALGDETINTRTETATADSLFRKKAPTRSHIGTATVEARMSRPAGWLHGPAAEPVSRVGHAQVGYLARETTDKPDSQRYLPREGIIQTGEQPGGGSAAHNDPGSPDPSSDNGLPARGLSRATIVRKVTDGANFRDRTLENMQDSLSPPEMREISDYVTAALHDTRLAGNLAPMTRSESGSDGVELLQHGKFRITGRAEVRHLEFKETEHEGGNAYLLNDVNQAKLNQRIKSRQIGWRLLFGPHGRFADFQASLLGGGGGTVQRRYGATFSETARISANAKFARPHVVFDGTTRITLTVHNGETSRELPALDVHGPILIPKSETRISRPDSPSEPRPSMSESLAVHEESPRASNFDRPRTSHVASDGPMERQAGSAHEPAPIGPPESRAHPVDPAPSHPAPIAEDATEAEPSVAKQLGQSFTRMAQGLKSLARSRFEPGQSLSGAEPQALLSPEAAHTAHRTGLPVTHTAKARVQPSPTRSTHDVEPRSDESPREDEQALRIAVDQAVTRVEQRQPPGRVDGPVNCVLLLEGLRETFNPDGVHAARTVDESAVLDSGTAERLMDDDNWSRTAEQRIAPGAEWVDIGDWSDAESAARRAGRGSTVYVLMGRPSGEGHAFALRHTEAGRLFWVDPQMPSEERLLAAHNRPGLPAEWAQRGGDQLESAVSTRVLVADSDGLTRPELVVKQSESTSTARAITDAPSDPGYGKGGFEKEKPRYRVKELPANIHPNTKIVTGLVNITTDKSSEGKAILETVSDPAAMVPGETGPFSSDLIDRQREIDELLHNKTRIPNTSAKIKDIFSDASKYTIKPGAEDIEVFADQEQSGKDAVQYTGGTDADYDWAFLYQLRDKAFNAPANAYLLEGLDFGRRMARRFTASSHSGHRNEPYPGFLVEALHSDKNVAWVRAIATSAYLHNSGVLRWRMHVKTGGQSAAGPKNFTPAVSRVSATALIGAAPPEVRRFFAADPKATREFFLQTFLANDRAARARLDQHAPSDSDLADIGVWRLPNKPGGIPGEPWTQYFDNFLLPRPDVPIDQYRAMGVRTRFAELDTNPSENGPGLDLWELRYLDESVVDPDTFESRFNWLRTTLTDVHREAEHSRRADPAEVWQPVREVSKFATPNITRDQFLSALDDAWNQDQAGDSQQRDALLKTEPGRRVKNLIDGLNRSEPATWHTLIGDLTRLHQRMSRFHLDQVGRHPIASSRELLDRQLKQSVADLKDIVGELKSVAPPWLETSRSDDRGRLETFADQVVQVARQQQGPVQVHVDAGIPKGSGILTRTAGQKEASKVGDALLSLIRDRLRDAGLAVDRVSLVATSRGSGSLTAQGYTVTDDTDRRAAVGWVTVSGAAPAPPTWKPVLPPIASGPDLGDLGMSSFLDNLNS